MSSKPNDDSLEGVTGWQITPDENGCAVCTTKWKVGDAIIAIEPCHHTVHDACMNRWVMNLPATANVVPCPICRATVRSQRHFQLPSKPRQ